MTRVTAFLPCRAYVVIMQAETAVTEATGLKTLEEVFRWAIRREERLMPGEVVVQDEYTHDVVFLAADGSALVFDAT